MIRFVGLTIVEVSIEVPEILIPEQLTVPHGVATVPRF
jgi:hypothetical protein